MLIINNGYWRAFFHSTKKFVLALKWIKILSTMFFFGDAKHHGILCCCITINLNLLVAFLGRSTGENILLD